MTGHSSDNNNANFSHPQSNFGKSIKPMNGTTTINGRKVASTDFNNGGYSQNINLPDYQQGAMVSAGRNIQQLIPSIRSAIATNPNEQAQFANELYQPQRQNLINEYHNVLGNTINNANASGTLSSIGFQNYRANQLDKNLGQGLSDLYNQSQIQSYQLPQLKLAPIEQAIGTLTGVGNDITNQGLQMLNPSLAAAQLGNTWSANRYTGEQQQLINQINAQQQAQQLALQRVGFLGSL